MIADDANVTGSCSTRSVADQWLSSQLRRLIHFQESLQQWHPLVRRAHAWLPDRGNALLVEQKHNREHSAPLWNSYNVRQLRRYRPAPGYRPRLRSWNCAGWADTVVACCMVLFSVSRGGIKSTSRNTCTRGACRRMPCFREIATPVHMHGRSLSLAVKAHVQFMISGS